jgi:hypothetical protein
MPYKDPDKQREWRLRNKEKWQAYSREYRVSYKERRKVVRKAWSDQNRDWLNVYRGLWVAGSPNKVKAYEAKRKPRNRILYHAAYYCLHVEQSRSRMLSVYHAGAAKQTEELLTQFFNQLQAQ